MTSGIEVIKTTSETMDQTSFRGQKLSTQETFLKVTECLRTKYGGLDLDTRAAILICHVFKYFLDLNLQDHSSLVKEAPLHFLARDLQES